MKKFTLSLLLVLLFSLMPLGAVSAQEADVEPPSNVEGLTAEPLNEAVKLTWLPATDNVGVTGYEVHYGLTAVTEQGQTYDASINVGDVLEYTVTDLDNDTRYYFSVIAYDAAGNESVAWADGSPLAATPTAEAGDNGEPPQVADAEALNKEQVLVVFSKEIVLPSVDPQDAFLIENNEDFTELVVLDAEMYEDDETNKTVLLTTEEQEEDVEYTLTANIAIKDRAGVPIVSGTSDTALFVGSDLEFVEEESLVVVKVEPIDSTNFGVTFNKPIVLGIDPSSNFRVHSADDPTDVLTVFAVTLGENHEGVEDAFAVVRTSPHTSGETYFVTVLGVTDESGNPIDDDFSSATFTASVEDDDEDDDDEDIVVDPPDTTPPVDVTELLATKSFHMNKYIVTLKWALPVDVDWDSVAQKLYMSTDFGENFIKTADLSPDVDEYELDDLDVGEYWFKLTQTDEAGNESEGVMVKVVLSETGPGVVGLLLVSLGLGKLVTRRKRL